MEMVKIRRYIILSLLIITGFTLYFYKRSSALTEIPFVFTISGTPAVITAIEDKSYLLEVDLGSKFPLTLDEKVLESIKNKKKHHPVYWKDAKGNSYESSSYLLPRIQVKSLALQDILVHPMLST